MKDKQKNNQQIILIAEDEPKMRKVIKNYLEAAGFSVEETDNGSSVLELIKKIEPTLLLLDLMLPGLSGEKVCQQLRQFSDIPILMLTARGKPEERVRGLELGADDYLVKPFNPRELIARIKAILRRTNNSKKVAEKIILGEGKIKIYPLEMKVTVNDRDVELTATEFNILNTLLSHPLQILSREQLAERALGLEFSGYDRTIDVHIKNIRQKLNLQKNEYIVTVYGQGYKFEGDDH